MPQRRRNSILLETQDRLGILTRTHKNMMMVTIHDKDSGETHSGELNIGQILFTLNKTLKRRETIQYYRMKTEFYK